MPAPLSHRRPARRTVACLVLLSALASGCTDGLSFRQDERLKIVSPLDGELVGEPVLVEWQMKPRPASVKKFLVFVDRAPQPPGQSVEHFKPDDRSNIYESSTNSVEIAAFESAATGPKNRRNRHRVLIIPLDALGRRIGEASDHVEIDVFRDEP